MEINEYRQKQTRLHKTAASEYEASQAKAQQIKPYGHEQKPVQISKNENSIVKGEIIDLRYQEVKIRLEPSGQIISAKLSGEVPLSIGQTAEFVVSDETDGVITLKYIQTGSSPVNDIIHKALYASGLTASERNLSIVSELLNYQMPVDKNTILQLIKLTSSYPDVNVSTLILMHKNNLPINISSIAQFEAYQKGTHQVLTQLKSLLGNINTMASGDTIQARDEVSPDMLFHANKSTISEEAYAKNILNTNNEQFEFQSNVQLDNNLSNIISSNNDPSEIAQSNITQSIITQSNIDSLNTSYLSIDATADVINLHKDLLALLIEGEDRPERASLDTAIGRILSLDELTILKEALLTKVNESSHYNNETMESIQNQLSNGSITLESLLNLVHDLYDNDTTQALSNNNTLTIKLAEAFIGMSSQLSGDERERLVHLLKSDSYREIITEALHQRWTLSPRDLTKENKVKEFFRQLDEDMEHLDKMADDFYMPSNIKASINKLQDNLQFMKDLNELFLYLQLPIRFKEQDAHGDLYVFTRKNQKHKDKEDLNVLLYLDMTNLGPLDIHMSMRSHQVNAVFYVEKPSVEIITKHLHELTDALNEKGYQLQARTLVSDSMPDFITDILQQDAPSRDTHRYTFDIRA